MLHLQRNNTKIRIHDINTASKYAFPSSSTSSYTPTDLKYLNERKGAFLYLRRVLSIRNIFLSLLVVFLITIAFTVWGLSFRASKNSIKLLTSRIRDQVGEQVAQDINRLFSRAQDSTAVFKNFLDVNLNYGRDLWVGDEEDQIVLNNIQYSVLFTQQEYVNSVNFVSKTGTLASWEVMDGQWTYYRSNRTTLDMEIYFMSDPVRRIAKGPPIVVPNFNLTLVIPTYHVAIKEANETGMFFPVSRHINKPTEVVTSIARPYFNGNGELMGTINAVFMTRGIKNTLVKVNPSKKGYVIVMQDDMVVVSDSIADHTASIDMPCGSNHTFIVSLCNVLKSKGGMDKFGTVQAVGDMTVLKKNLAFPGITFHVFIGMADSEFFQGVVKQSYTTLWVSGLVLLAALVLSLLTTFTFLRTLGGLAAAFSSIRRLDVDSKFIHKISKGKSLIYEIRELQDNFRSMLVALRSIKKYVPAQVVKTILESGEEAELGLVPVNCTIFFMDIENFTSISERLTPVQLIELMSDIFDWSSQIITSNGGVIDKYIGDCIMAVWNAPKTVDNHELSACRAAAEIQTMIEDNNTRLASANLPLIHSRIGIHTATVLAGNFGSCDRFSYTVMGDGVNETSRLEAMNKQYHTRVLISDATYQGALSSILQLITTGAQLQKKATDLLVCRRVEKAAVKGKTKSRVSYQLLSLEDLVIVSYSPSDLVTYEAAFDLFQLGSFVEAKNMFTSIEHKDAVIQTKIDQCNYYIEHGKPDNWDGTIFLSSK